MKKIIKKLKANSLFIFFLGVIVTSGVVYGTNMYESNTIKYKPSDTSWEVSNVNEAINSLYSMKQELDNIKKIGNATSSNILSGKTAVVQGNKVTGTMTNLSNQGSLWINTDNGKFYNNVSHTYSNGTTTNEMVTFYSKHSGYFDNTTKFIFGEKSWIQSKIRSGETFLGVTGTYTSDATATSSDILSGKTAYVNGNKVTGVMNNNGSITKKIVVGGNYKIPSGYHNGSGVVNVSHIIKKWCPNYGNWVSYSSVYTTDEYSISATSFYVLVRAENGGTVYQQSAPTCTNGTVTLIINNDAGLLYKINKTEEATFKLSIGMRRDYSTYPNATLTAYAFTAE